MDELKREDDFLFKKKELVNFLIMNIDNDNLKGLSIPSKVELILNCSKNLVRLDNIYISQVDLKISAMELKKECYEMIGKTYGNPKNTELTKQIENIQKDRENIRITLDNLDKQVDKVKKILRKSFWELGIYLFIFYRDICDEYYTLDQLQEFGQISDIEKYKENKRIPHDNLNK